MNVIGGGTFMLSAQRRRPHTARKNLKRAVRVRGVNYADLRKRAGNVDSDHAVLFAELQRRPELFRNAVRKSAAPV